jgi:hypothetical protein
LDTNSTRFKQLCSAIRYILVTFQLVSIVEVVAGGIQLIKKVIDSYISTHSNPSTQRHFLDMVKLMVTSISMAFPLLRSNCIWILNELVALYRKINSKAMKYIQSMHSEVNLKLAGRLITKGT